MKKKAKKLVLSKETLKILEEQPVLQEVAGGVTDVSVCFPCTRYWTECLCTLE